MRRSSHVGDLSRWYRGRLIVGPFGLFKAGELEDLEREIGLPLPSSYRSFLETGGGGSLMYSVRLPACEPEPFQSFDDLYPLGRDDDGENGWGTLLGEYRRSRDGRLAGEVSLAGLLPIARNGGSDTLFLDLNPATHGQLFAFVHGIPHPRYLSRGVFTHVGDGFDDYLDMLVVDPDLAADTWADVADSDSTDPWRQTVEEWLDKELPGWRAEPWAVVLCPPSAVVGHAAAGVSLAASPAGSRAAPASWHPPSATRVTFARTTATPLSSRSPSLHSRTLKPAPPICSAAKPDREAPSGDGRQQSCAWRAICEIRLGDAYAEARTAALGGRPVLTTAIVAAPLDRDWLVEVEVEVEVEGVAAGRRPGTVGHDAEDPKTRGSPAASAVAGRPPSCRGREFRRRRSWPSAARTPQPTRGRRSHRPPDGRP